jgi:hypothetical protein
MLHEIYIWTLLYSTVKKNQVIDFLLNFILFMKYSSSAGLTPIW